MRNFSLTFLLVLAVFAATTHAQTTPSAADAAAIKQTALDYIEGWYEGNAERMERALHPELAKRIVRTKDGDSRLEQIGAMTLVQRTRRGGGKNTPKDNQQKDITILDVFENAASVKIVASDWIDYLHLAKYDGRWVVVNVLWELKPTTRGTSVAEQQVRRVEGQILTSTALPAVRLQFDNKFKYVGNQSFILYDNARVEQNFFVDADGQGRIKRLYWVQFEGYLPNNTETYNYKVNKTVNLGGLDFIADAYARNIKDNSGRPGSDGSRARAFLESKGYRMASDDIISQRLVHLPDESKRNELMIIYTEDLSAMKLTAADVSEGGRAAARWGEISKRLLERAVRDLKILH